MLVHVYLKRAIENYMEECEELETRHHTKHEWNQTELLVTILLPFKRVSDRLESTHRRSNDSVF